MGKAAQLLEELQVWVLEGEAEVRVCSVGAWESTLQSLLQGLMSSRAGGERQVNETTLRGTRDRK